MRIFGWYKSSHRKLELWSFSTALVPTALLAAHLNFIVHLPNLIEDLCIALATPGGIVFLILIGGPHGGGNRLISTIAGFAATYVNALVYFWIARGVATLRLRLQRNSR